MEKRLLCDARSHALCLAIVAATGSVTAQEATPTGLNAEVDGAKVTLSWSREAYGEETLVTNDFEGTAFPGDGWTVKSLNTSDYRCSWFRYPTDDFTYLDNWTDYIHGGDGSAMVYMDAGAHRDGSSANQSEWLVSPCLGEGAMFLDFWSFIDPMLLEYGADEAFPDHYMVKVSHDDGATWQTLWDARTEASPFGGWQQVSLSLGIANATTRVAFHAEGDQADPTAPLYFLWAIDDIAVSGYEVLPTQAVATQAADASGVSHYTVYMDGKMVADNVKSLTYIDTLEKSVGDHTYSVTYYNALTGQESAAAETVVSIAEATLNPPTNVVVTLGYDDFWESYAATITWDAPEGDRIPAYYAVDCNGLEVASLLTEMEFTQTDITKGVYDYSVRAVYEYPDGASEGVGDEVALDTRYPVRNLMATLDGGAVSMTWNAPKAEADAVVSSYNVYRGNTLLEEGTTETSYIDGDAPLGVYDYSVVAVYDDGVASVARSVSVDNGGVEILDGSLAEDFTGGMTPDNWVVENVYPEYTDNMYMWRFDNFFDLPIVGEGFSGQYASIDGLSAGFASVVSTLTAPPVALEIHEGNNLTLTFAIDYMTEGDAEAAIDYSLDNGESWESLGELPSYSMYDLGDDETCRPQTVAFDLTDKVNDGDILMLRWGYNATYDGHIAIDNVTLRTDDPTGIQSQPTAAGLVVSVRDGAICASALDGSALEVYTASGNLVAASANGQQLTTKRLAAGVYLVKKTGNSAAVVRKVTVR